MYPTFDREDDFQLEKPPASLEDSDRNYVIRIPDSTPHATVNVVQEDSFSPARSCCCATKICLVGWALTFLLLAVALAVSGAILTYGLGDVVYNFEPDVSTVNVVVPWEEQFNTEAVTMKPFDVVYYAVDTSNYNWTSSDTRTLKMCVDASNPAVSAYAQVGYAPILDDDDYYFYSSQVSLSEFYSPPETFKEAIELPPCSLVPFADDEGINVCTSDAVVYVTVVAEYNEDGTNSSSDVSLRMYYGSCEESCQCYYRIALGTVFGLIIAAFVLLILASCCIACVCCTCCCIVHFGSASSKKTRYEYGF